MKKLLTIMLTTATLITMSYSASGSKSIPGITKDLVIVDNADTQSNTVTLTQEQYENLAVFALIICKSSYIQYNNIDNPEDAAMIVADNIADIFPELASFDKRTIYDVSLYSIQIGIMLKNMGVKEHDVENACVDVMFGENTQ